MLRDHPDKEMHVSFVHASCTTMRLFYLYTTNPVETLFISIEILLLLIRFQYMPDCQYAQKCPLIYFKLTKPVDYSCPIVRLLLWRSKDVSVFGGSPLDSGRRNNPPSF